MLTVLAATPRLALAAPHDGPARLGERFQVAVSAERLLGVGFERTQLTPAEPGSSTDEFRHLSLFLLGPPPHMFYLTASRLVPRLGIDVFLLRGLSLGAAVAAWQNTSEFREPDEPVAPQPREWAVLGGPRLGYAVRLGERFTLWPRAGLAFLRSDWSHEWEDEYPYYGSSTERYTFRISAITLEGLLAWAPAAHFEVYLGPFADLGTSGSLVGSYGISESETRIAMRTYGVTMGLGATVP